MIEIVVPILVGGCFGVWWRIKKIKAEQIPMEVSHIAHIPVLQCVICTFFCVASLLFDGDLPKDEINRFIEEYKIVGDLSTALFGLDLTSDQVTMYVMTDNLHAKALYILMGSIAMMLLQIIGPYNYKLNRLVVEGVAVVHMACIFYIGNLLGEAYGFMCDQIGTLKLLNALSSDTSSDSWGMVALAFIPFLYLYHYVLGRYYSSPEGEIEKQPVEQDK